MAFEDWSSPLLLSRIKQIHSVNVLQSLCPVFIDKNIDILAGILLEVADLAGETCSQMFLVIILSARINIVYSIEALYCPDGSVTTKYEKID